MATVPSYGSSSSVTALGVVDNSFLGENRKIYVGTNGGTDGGGVSVMNGMGTPFVEKVYHSNAGLVDDNSTSWGGTDYDDMQSIGVNGSAVAMGSIANLWTEQEKVNLQTTTDKLANNLYSIRAEMAADGLAGSSHEIGVNGGADLAEYYKSPETLEAGMIVATGDTGADTVKKTIGSYQKDVLGIVATAPGMILGTREEDSYPVALAGRVPMNITTENGMIARGDQVTSSSLPGYGMVAIEAGRVIGTVLEDPNMEAFTDCPVDSGLPIGIKCGQVTVFVNLTDFTGVTMEDLMTKQGYDSLTQDSDFSNIFSSMAVQDLGNENIDGNSVIKSEWTDIFKAANTLGFMKKLNDPVSGSNFNSEILAKNINATGSVVSPLIVTDTLIAKNIKAENIEGLNFMQTNIQTAQDGVATNATEVKSLGEQILDLQSGVKALNQKSDWISTGIISDLKADGGLTVAGKAEFQGPAIFKKLAEFIDKVIFRNNVEFEGQVVFNKDTAGYAIVKEGTDTVEITFEKEYETVPVVTASLSLQQIKDDQLRKAAEELLLVSDAKFIITNVTTKGFEIKIAKKEFSDIPFAWQVIAVKDVRTFETTAMQSENKTDMTSETDGQEIIPVAVTTSADVANPVMSTSTDVMNNTSAEIQSSAPSNVSSSIQ